MDRLPYMGGWVDSDVAIVRNRKGEGVLRMTTSHLWQMAETHALFDWSKVVGHRMNLTLEGPKLAVTVEAPLEELDEAIRKSAEDGWLKTLGDKEGLEDLKHVKSWDGLKRWVAGRWGVVVDAAVSRLRKVLKEELRRLLAPKGRDAAKRRKGGQDAPRDGENVWEELRRRLNALRDRLNDDKIAREVVAPALLLMQAQRLGVNETTLRYFAAVISGAIDGHGHVSAAKEVGLTSGEREIALLWGAVLAAHGVETEVMRVKSGFQVVASGYDAVKLAGLYFLYGPPLLEGDDRFKSHKLYEAMKLAAEGLSVSWEGLRRRTDDGPVAADLTISAAGVAVKYNVYLRDRAIELKFKSTDQSRVELAARLLELAGVNVEVTKVGNENVWQVEATTDKLAAGREELRKALANIVRKAVEKGWVDAGKAERWLEKLERGLTLMEGWPKYLVRLDHHNSLEIRFASTSPDSIEQEAQRLEMRGLKEGKHFSVKMPEEGHDGYVRILKEGLAYAAWLSVRGEDEQQRRLAAELVEFILQRAEDAGEDVRKKAEEIVRKGKSRGSQKLEGFEKKVEVNGKTYVVKVTGWGAKIEESQRGKKLLRIKIKADVGRVEGRRIVDSVEHEYTITYRRGADNEARGQAYAGAKAPGGKEAYAERFSALVKALTGKEPGLYHMEYGILMVCGREHLEGFLLYAELIKAIEEWLEETSRR